VLPNAHHAPAFLPERFRHEPIAGLIAGNFLEPELRIVLRFHPMLRTAMPEATVDKYSLHNVVRRAGVLVRDSFPLLFPELASCLVNDGAVCLDPNRNDVFIDCDCVVEFARSLHELRQANH
jgi:hypothetical protein